MTTTLLNKKYGELNERFDNRALELITYGFQYEKLLEYHIAVFSRKNPVVPNRMEYITASFVMHADSDIWQDKLKDISVQY